MYRYYTSVIAAPNSVLHAMTDLDMGRAILGLKFRVPDGIAPGSRLPPRCRHTSSLLVKSFNHGHRPCIQYFLQRNPRSTAIERAWHSNFVQDKKYRHVDWPFPVSLFLSPCRTASPLALLPLATGLKTASPLFESPASSERSFRRQPGHSAG